MKSSSCFSKSKKIMLYMSCMLSFMIFANNTHNTVSCKQNKEVQIKENKRKNKTNKIKKNKNDANATIDYVLNLYDSLQGKWIDTPIFKDEQKTTLVQGVCSYTINKAEKYIDVELRGIINPEGLDISLVPIVGDVELPQVVLQKEGNNYKTRVTWEESDHQKMFGKILFKFYYVNPAAKNAGAEYQFKVGVVDVFYLQNLDRDSLQCPTTSVGQWNLRNPETGKYKTDVLFNNSKPIVLLNGKYLLNIFIRFSYYYPDIHVFPGKVFVELEAATDASGSGDYLPVYNSRTAVSSLPSVTFGMEDGFYVAITEITNTNLNNNVLLKIYSDELKGYKYIAYYQFNV